ncbi:MAG: hypothetical protein QTN59_01130 [Candidatus Electrothrix communis]|nr:MAG: hypothetical protein QTN59_01130 [Candidatus Electrothrix communis]
MIENVTFVDEKIFFALPVKNIAKLVQNNNYPQVGIFLPDGNRRLVSAMTGLDEMSDDFFTQLAITQASLFLNTLKVFFSHGLTTLFVPLFSHSVLMRGAQYRNITVLKTLEILLANEEWINFYNIFDIRVKIYGNLSVLQQVGCERALHWIKNIEKTTKKKSTHMLFLGVGGESLTGYDAAQGTINFYKQHQREPSLNELIEILYGQLIPPADFFIISSKLAGLGALPAFLCDGDTQVYYLPAPGVYALTEQSYRKILYDLIYMRESKDSANEQRVAQDEHERLIAWYANHATDVIGLGKKIGSVWVPNSTEGN